MKAKATLPKEVSADDLATLLGITKRSVNDLAERKLLPRLSNGRFNLAESIPAYIAHREQVLAREAGSGAWGEARAELTLEKARMARMQREEMEGSLLPIESVRNAWTAVLTMVRSRLLALPSKLAPRLLGKRHAAEVEALIRADLYEAMEDLSDHVTIKNNYGKIKGNGELGDRL